MTAALFLFAALLRGAGVKAQEGANGSAQAGLDIEKLKGEFESRVKKYTLENGLRLILVQNGTSPTVACYLKIGVGSANEPFDQAGTAHFLEHLLFKGTDTIGTADFEKEILYLRQMQSVGDRIDAMRLQLSDPLLSDSKRGELESLVTKEEAFLAALQKMAEPLVISEEDSKVYSLAGQVGYNAYTSADVTNYQVKLPKNRLELWAYMESSRFASPVFRQFYKERAVISEERRMRYDSKPSSLLYELFIKTSFGMSPYGKPVIGFANNIPKMTWEGTQSFFEENYVPSRMVIAIVGDIEFEETYALIAKYFENIPAREPAGFPPIEFEAPIGRKTAELEADHSPVMITGWHKPGAAHPDDIVYDVLQKILTDGKTSRLVKRLVIDDKLATDISAYNGLPGAKLPNSFTFFIRAYSEENYDPIEKAIAEELQKIVQEGVRPEELEKVKNGFYRELIDSLSSNAGLADTLSFYEVILGDYRIFFDYLENLERVSEEDIRRVIETTFQRKNNTTVWIKKPAP